MATPNELSDRQVHTILAALRLYQLVVDSGSMPLEIEALSQEGDTQPLSTDEIDDLCEQINLG